MIPLHHVPHDHYLLPVLDMRKGALAVCRPRQKHFSVAAAEAQLRQWTHWDLSPEPSAGEADVMPLHRVPHGHYLLPVLHLCTRALAVCRPPPKHTSQWQRRVGFEPRTSRTRGGRDATRLCAPKTAACFQKWFCICAHLLLIALARNTLPQPQLRHSCANGHTGI